MEKEFIMGTCEEGILVGCVSTERGYFSFSVDTYNLVEIDELIGDYAVDYIYNYLEEGIEHPIIYLLTNYYSSIESIAEDIVENMDESELLNFISPDIDYNVGEIMIKDKDYVLELNSCGQIDFREFNCLTEKNKEFNGFVYNLWRDYHLTDNENIPKEKLAKLENFINNIKNYDIEMEEYISNNLEMVMNYK